LARAGTRVVLVGRTGTTLEAVAAEVTEVGPPGRVAVANTSDPQAVSALREDLASENVSILVNNAGIAGPAAALVDVEPSDWTRCSRSMCAAHRDART
jgi:NAD(P)-dependent dehydrogenase (short-subunit alcohol dehydrogenase family)